MNPSPLIAVDEFLLFFVGFFKVLCFVLFGCFLVDMINVRSCVSPNATTRQTPVGYSLSLQQFFFPQTFYYAPLLHTSPLGAWHLDFLFIYLFIYFLLAGPTHTYPPGSGLGIYKRTQQYLLHNEAGSKTPHVFITMKLAVTHSISSSQ